MPRVVSVALTNRKASLSLPGDLYDEFREFLKYRRPGWEYTTSGRVYVDWCSRVKKGEADPDEPMGWDGYIHLLEGRTVGAGIFLALKEKLETEFDVRFVSKDERVSPQFSTPTREELPEKVRDYQWACLQKMLAASKTGGLILNATGTGKTFSTGLYFKQLKGNALFLVDELTLLKQAINELRDVLQEDIGEIGNSVFRPRRITVATIQTIHRHRFDYSFVAWNKTLKAIVIDEVHLALNRRNFQTVAAIRPPVIFGLTATLELKKKSVAYRAYDLCGPVVFEYPLVQGVEEGFLARGVAVSVELKQGVKGARIRGNPRWRWVRERYKQQYQELYSEIIVEGKKRNEFIVAIVQEAYKRGKHIIVLLQRINHITGLSKRLKGIPHRLVFGQVSVENRMLAQKHFEKEKVRVILTNVVFKKGINIKRIDVIVDGAAMKSKNDAVQKYGRGVRLCDGKDGLLYFDIADSGNRFEKAAISRRTALVQTKIPTFKVSSELGAREILRLAEKRLQRILAG